MPTRRIRHADIVRHFAERLRALRLAREMTQRDLARHARVTVSYVSTLEAGQRAPGIDLLDRLARALGVHATDLLPAASETEMPEALRADVQRLIGAVLPKSGPDSLTLLKLFLERLAESPALNR